MHLGVRITKLQYSSRLDPHQVHTKIPAYKVDNNDKSVESTGTGKNPEGDFSTLNPIIKCYNYQGYGHVAANYPTLFKIVIIDRVFVETPKPDSTISRKSLL